MPVRIFFWNLGFLIFVAAALAIAASNKLDAIAFGLPALLAVWILFQGGLYAQRRWVVLTCASLGALLFLLQMAVLVFFVWWNQGFGNKDAALMSQVFLLWALVIAAVALAWFVRAKLGKGKQRLRSAPPNVDNS
jgi:hypothetical protein